MLEVYPSCGDATKVSATWSATASSTLGIGGGTIEVFGSSRNVVHTSKMQTVGLPVEASAFNIGRDEPVNLTLTRIGTSITSFQIFPEENRPFVHAAIYAGSLVVAVSTEIPYPFLFIVPNNVKKDFLVVGLNPPETPIPPGARNWETDPGPLIEGETLFFPPGSHSVGHLFAVPNNCTLLFRGGSWTDGNYDFARGGFPNIAANILFEGAGVLSSLYTTPEFTTSLPFNEGVKYATFTTSDGISEHATNCIARGMIIMRPAHFINWEGVNILQRVKAINAWHWGMGGIGPFGDAVLTTLRLGFAQECLSINADDNFQNDGPQTIFFDRCYAINTRGAGYHFGWYALPSTHALITNVVINCGVLHWYLSGTELPASKTKIKLHGAFKATVDAANGQSDYKKSNLNFIDVKVDDMMDCGLFVFANLKYPDFVPPGDQFDSRGQINNVLLKNIVLSNTPVEKAQIQGMSPVDTPHDFIFENVDIALGVKLTKANLYDKVDINTFPYNLTFV